ncbi:VOC family protein [Thermaurantiacus sp.]
MRAFLEDFGLETLAASDARLAMGAPGADAACHVTEAGEPSFVGATLSVGSHEELQALSVHGDADDDGVVTLTDPDGFAMRMVVGAPGAGTAQRRPYNVTGMAERIGVRGEAPPGAAHVRRLGHIVLEVTDFARSLAWYQAMFGLLVSDVVLDPSGTQPFAAFLRLDRGAEPVDHHTVVLLGLGRAAFGHAAFEVVDFDDLMRGHDHLQRAGHRHAWGVGRHIMGAQIFDYWRDPWGNMLEHWTDGDLLDATAEAQTRQAVSLVATQWGPWLKLEDHEGNLS